MGAIRTAADLAYADDDLSGDPKHPDKAAIRALFGTVEDAALGTISISPLSAAFGGVGDGVTDDLVALQACMDYCAGLAASGAFRVQMDLGGKAWRVIAGPVNGKSGVVVVNGTGLFSTVALHTTDYQPVFAWIVWEGTISAANDTLILETTILGSQETVIGASAGLTAGQLVMVTHTPPIANLSAGITNAATTIPIGAGVPAAWPSAGQIWIDSECITYTSKDATNVYARATGGRAQRGTSAAAHSSGARISLHHGGWYWQQRSTPRIPAELNYVFEAPRNLQSGKRSLLLRYAHDRKYSPTLDAGIRKITPVTNVGLRNVTLTGTTAQGRVGGYEVGWYTRYVDTFMIDNWRMTLCSDKHGWCDSSINGLISDGFVLGKADSSTYDGHYGPEIANCSTNIHVSRVQGRNIFKVVTFGASGLSSAAASQTWRGVPRWVWTDHVSMGNGGNPRDNAHGIIEPHTPVQHAFFKNTYGWDAQELVSLDGGEDITVEGGACNRWGRQAAGADGCFEMRGLKLGDFSIGERSLLAIGTRLANGINNSQTTMDLTDASWITDLTNDFTPVHGLVGTEKIQLGSRDSGNGFTGMTRALFGSTAASHLTGDRLYPLGSYEAIPLDFDFTQCKLLLKDPDQQADVIDAAAMTNSVTTVPVKNLALWPDATAGAPQFAEIEGESSGNGYASEVVSYTGKSGSSGAGTLTGVTRGMFGTEAVAHSADRLVMPYTCALTDIDIHDIDCNQDIPRPVLNITGYNPSENCVARGIGGRWKQATRNTEYAVVLQPHRWGYHPNGKKLVGFSYGVRSSGHEQEILGVSATRGLADTTGGAAVYVEGDRTIVERTKARNLYGAVETAAAADKTSVQGSRSYGATAANGVTDGGTNSSKVDNVAI